MAFDLVGKAVKKIKLPTVNYDSAPIKIIPAQSGDINSRFLIIELYDDRGTVDLTPYTKATFNATMPDETLQIALANIKKDTGEIICKVAGSMLKETGKVACDVMLQGTDANDEQICLTSQTFYIFVANSQTGDEAIESDDNYGLLLQLLAEVSEVETHIEEAEASRVQAESSRVQAESARVGAESARVTAENNRASAESSRATAESSRVSAETSRVNAESARVSAENSRVSAENARVTAENQRASAESSRANAEAARVSAETNRATAETNRVNAENTRVEAETNRETAFNTSKQACDAATTRANNAAETVDEVLSALPCETQISEGSTTTGITLLKFVKLEG